jgi:uncharacterized membrane protein YqjE
MIETRTDTRSLGELFSELASNVSVLLKNEIKLARLELTEKTENARSGVMMLAAGAAVAYAGFLVLLAAATAGLVAAGLPWWAAALIVGTAVVVAGAALLKSGQGQLSGDKLAPRETIQSLQTNAEWAKGRM